MEENVLNRNQAEGDGYCFGCGPNNPHGLHLDFREEGERFVTKKTLTREYQSYGGTVHGGIVSTMLDEAMGGYLYEISGKRSVTARMDVRYRHPTPVGEELTISGWIDSKKGKFVKMKAEIALPDGTITAEGTATIAVME